MITQTHIHNGQLGLARFLVGLCLCLLSAGYAQNDFATLEVQPYGEQVYDLATDSTLLPSGGRIVEREINVTLDTSYASYREGSFIAASNANVAGNFGTLQTGSLYLDIPNEVLRTEQGTSLRANGLNIDAQNVTVYLDPAIAVGRGGIRSASPAFESAGIVVDTLGNAAFLTAPYTYQDGPFTLRSNTPGDLLQVVWFDEADGSTSFEASSQSDPTIYNRLARFIAMLTQ